MKKKKEKEKKVQKKSSKKKKLSVLFGKMDRLKVKIELFTTLIHFILFPTLYFSIHQTTEI